MVYTFVGTVIILLSIICILLYHLIENWMDKTIYKAMKVSLRKRNKEVERLRRYISLSREEYLETPLREEYYGLQLKLFNNIDEDSFDDI